MQCEYRATLPAEYTEREEIAAVHKELVASLGYHRHLLPGNDRHSQSYLNRLLYGQKPAPLHWFSAALELVYRLNERRGAGAEAVVSVLTPLLRRFPRVRLVVDPEESPVKTPEAELLEAHSAIAHAMHRAADALADGELSADELRELAPLIHRMHAETGDLLRLEVSR